MPEVHLARILIVDDEVAQMKALCHTLQDAGYETTGYSAPRAALEQVTPDRFDLLLTDLAMPDMDGIALMQAAFLKDPNLVGIIMTGEGTIATAVAAMKTGALDFILKPFKLSVILPVLDRAMKMRSLRLENEHLTRAVHERSQRLQEANQELEAFSYSVSHDLRAPLRHIIGFAECIVEDADITEAERLQHIERIIRLARDMDGLIFDLLEFSQINRTEMRRKDVSLRELVDDAIHKLRPDVEDRHIVWTLDELPHASGDPALLRQVFGNLLFNAVKYTRPRDPAKIEIGARTEAGEIVVFIRDNGVGFDMRYVEQLFNVFSRLHRKEEFEGTGIGLANVRRIIHRHGGRTWAEGKVGEGATFYFSLPR